MRPELYLERFRELLPLRRDLRNRPQHSLEKRPMESIHNVNGAMASQINSSHTAVPGVKPSSIEAEILRAIGKKQNKGGAAYVSGKTLVMFLNSGGGEWYPNNVARQLPVPLHFDADWVVGLQRVEERGQYIYAVSLLDLSPRNAPSWLVSIAPDFDNRQVESVQ